MLAATSPLVPGTPGHAALVSCPAKAAAGSKARSTVADPQPAGRRATGRRRVSDPVQTPTPWREEWPGLGEDHSPLPT